MAIPALGGSILPDILEVARDQGVVIGKSLQHRSEHRACCPFCGDEKYHLYLNPEKNTFKCFRCDTRGGVVTFISQLIGQPEHLILEELKEEARGTSNRPRREPKELHPALRLNTFQLREMGYEKVPNFYDLFKRDKAYADRVLNRIWHNWQSLIEYELTQAMKILYLFLHHGCYSKAIENIKKRSKELGVDLLTPCLKEYSNQNESPKWVNDAKELVRLWLKKPD